MRLFALRSIKSSQSFRSSYSVLLILSGSDKDGCPPLIKVKMVASDDSAGAVCCGATEVCCIIRVSSFWRGSDFDRSSSEETEKSQAPYCSKKMQVYK